MSYAIAQSSLRALAKGRTVRRRLQLLSLIAVLLACVVVVLGAFTRLKDAGLGCPDWPGCYGHMMWPDSADEVVHAEARFPEAPVEHDKTWPEMVHRYFAGALGLLILSLLVITLRSRRLDPGLPLKLPIAISLVVVLQAAFGMWTVTLKLWPQVVTAHLLGGFTTLGLLWLYQLRLRATPWLNGPAALAGIRPLAICGLLVCIAQVSLGGWTSSNYAALACPDLPTCHGVYWPRADFVQGFNVFQEVGPNYLGGLLDNHARTAIHLAHRIGALITTGILLLVVVALWRSGYSPARRLALVTASFLTAQLALGISNVYFALPLAIAVAHNGFGALVILLMVQLNHRLLTFKTSKEVRP